MVKWLWMETNTFLWCSLIFWRLKFGKQVVGGPSGPQPPLGSLFIGQPAGITTSTQHQQQWFLGSFFYFPHCEGSIFGKWIVKTILSPTDILFLNVEKILLYFTFSRSIQHFVNQTFWRPPVNFIDWQWQLLTWLLSDVLVLKQILIFVTTKF